MRYARMSLVRAQVGTFARSTRPRRGFTLIELLVVMAIILMVTVATLPVVLPAINQRSVSEAALLLQAELSRARDMAIRDNAPRGIRLLPDLATTDRFYFRGLTPAYNRMIPIETGPDYSEGAVRNFDPSSDPGLNQFSNPYPIATALGNWLIVMEAKTEQVVYGGVTTTVPRPPTSWFWNIRQGDRIRFGDSPRLWTVVGPMQVSDPALNPERYINWGTDFVSRPSLLPTADREFLVLVDGVDNDNDGYIDEAFDGIDNDGDGIIDPGFNGEDNSGLPMIDDPSETRFNSDGEFEFEEAPPIGYTDDTASSYTILRRPVPSRGARELTLPSGVVIDLTTWSNSNPERSRLPVDARTGYTEIMFAPNGQVVQPLAGPTEAYPPQYPFFHFWLTDVEDVVEPNSPGFDLNGDSNPDLFLPLPAGTPGTPAGMTRFLENNRRLITLNTRSGQVTTTTVENFNLSDAVANPAALDRPFLQAQSGVKDVLQ